MRIKLIACKVMETELRAAMERSGVCYDAEFLELGLHMYPDKLHKKLQSTIDASSGYDRIILGFGLCGMAAVGLSSADAVITIPNVHDCVPVLIGSKQHFADLHKEETGTYYMCRGFLENEGGFQDQYEEWCDDFGEDGAEMLKDVYYSAYKRLIYIDRPHPQATELKEQAKQSAGFLNLEYGETDARDDFIEEIISGPWDNGDLFINIPPTDCLAERHFGI